MTRPRLRPRSGPPPAGARSRVPAVFVSAPSLDAAPGPGYPARMAKPSHKRQQPEDALDLPTRRLQRADPRATSLAPLVRQMLEVLGEDVERQGLRDTPGRVDQSLKWLTRGDTPSPENVVAGAVVEERRER